MTMSWSWGWVLAVGVIIDGLAGCGATHEGTNASDDAGVSDDASDVSQTSDASTDASPISDASTDGSPIISDASADASRVSDASSDAVPAPLDAAPDTSTLGPPNGVTAEGGDAMVFIAWNPVPGATYAVYSDVTAGVDPETSPLLGRTVRTYFEHTELPLGIERYYVVVSERDGEVSGPSEEVSAIPADRGAPTAAIVFPPRLSSFTGDVLTVRGTAADDDQVAAVRVNGIVATSDDGFATWRAEVPVMGSVHVVVSTEDRFGNVDPAAAVADVGPDPGLGDSFGSPKAISIDAAGRLIVSDVTYDGFWAVDLATGDRTLLSRASNASGENVADPGRTVIRDSTAYTASPSQRAIYATDLNENDVSVFASAASAPSAMGRVTDLAFDAENDRLITIDTELASLRAFDPITGAAVELSGARGVGPSLAGASSLALSADGATAWVGASGGTVIEVDLESGDRALVYAPGPRPSDPEELRVDVPSGRAFIFDQGGILELHLDGSRAHRITSSLGASDAFEVDVTGDRAWLIMNFPTSLREVYEVDLATGQNRLVTDNTDPEPLLDNVIVARWSRIWGLLYLIDRDRRAVVSIDPETGARSLVSGRGRGSGDALSSPNGAVLSFDEMSLFVTDGGDDTVVRIDLASGDRSVVSSAALGEGTPFGAPVGIARWGERGADERLLVSEPLHRWIFDVGISTGDRGMPAQWPMQIEEIDTAPDLQRVFALQRSSNAVLEIDLTSQAVRTIDSRFESATALSSDGHGQLAVVDQGSPTLFVLDPVTGMVSAVSHHWAGRGEELGEPQSVLMHPSGEYWLVSDRSTLAIYAIDVVSGDRVVVSR